MGDRTLSGSRRTRFLDETRELEKPSDDNVVERPATAAFAVLHDAFPNLGSRRKESAARAAEASTPTLAHLTAEFNDLSRKMTMLKETIKATRDDNVASKNKSGPVRTNSSSQALQVGHITSVASAKLVVRDCISELISINQFLDGNEEIAAVYREKLRHMIAGEYGKPKDIVVRGISLVLDTRNAIPIEGKSTADSSIAASDHFLRQYCKDAEIQTDPQDPEIISPPPKSVVDESPDVTPVATGKKGQQSGRPVRGQKSKKWYSGCVCCATKQKSEENTENATKKISASKKNRSAKP